jgi:hypothetical protein
MTMSQQNRISLIQTSAPGAIETPCYAQCINLQTMHPDTHKRLALQYKTLYTLIRYELDPTPQHLGAWVQVSGIGKVNADGSREWIPASFFFINSVIWPN